MNCAATPKRILFRCDGTTQTGLGHVSRCLALAEALDELGCTCWFAGDFGAAANALLAERPREQFSLPQRSGSPEDGAKTAALAATLAADGVVLDSYAVDSAFVAQLAQQVGPLLVLDDFGALADAPCAALLNFTVGAFDLGYPTCQRLNLLGPEYFLARRRLRELRRRPRSHPARAANVCVAIGGVDRYDAAVQTVAALVPWAQRLAVRVVVAREATRGAALEALVVPFLPGSGVSHQPADLADELAWADVCVCGGGLVKYEAAFVGVPPAVLSQTSAQAGETAAFAARGLCFDLGLAAGSDSENLRLRLAAWINNPAGLASTHAAGLATFPEDPTHQTAMAFLTLLGR